ncbi:MAG: hypothetical protein KF716_05675 [Anaerolineae bacterium]|nr:hypothetical protein [Anaerolineae bacterium]
MSDTAVKRTFVIAMLVILIAIVGVVAVLLWELAPSGYPRGDYSQTANAIYATNTWVKLRVDETATATAATKRVEAQ